MSNKQKGTDVLDKTKNELTTTTNSAPEWMLEKAKEDAGAGVSHAASDNLVPLISVLQSNSPQVAPRNAAYIEGAAAGDFLLKGYDPPTIDGKEGFVFQPAYFVHDWVEWVPRDDGGGFVGRYPNKVVNGRDVPDVEGARQIVDPKDEDGKKLKWILGRNDLIETRSYAGIIPGVGEFMMPFASTGHTAAKDLMSRSRRKRVNGVEAPLWAARYTMKTIPKKNKKGEFFVVSVGEDGWVSAEGYVAGKALHMAFASGAKAAAAPDAQTVAEEDIPF